MLVLQAVALHSDNGVVLCGSVCTATPHNIVTMTSIWVAVSVLHAKAQRSQRCHILWPGLCASHAQRGNSSVGLGSCVGAAIKHIRFTQLMQQLVRRLCWTQADALVEMTSHNHAHKAVSVMLTLGGCVCAADRR